MKEKLKKKFNCKIIIKNEFNEKSYIMHKQTRKTIKMRTKSPKNKEKMFMKFARKMIKISVRRKSYK